MIMYPPIRMPSTAIAPLIAVSRRLVSGGGGGAGRMTVGVSGTPSTDLPQRHDMSGGRTRRPQAGHTRLIPVGP